MSRKRERTSSCTFVNQPEKRKRWKVEKSRGEPRERAKSKASRRERSEWGSGYDYIVIKSQIETEADNERFETENRYRRNMTWITSQGDYCRPLWVLVLPFPLPLPLGELEFELELDPLELDATAWTNSVFVLFHQYHFITQNICSNGRRRLNGK